MKAPHPNGLISHRVYSSTGRENAAQKTTSGDWNGMVNKADFKESYEIGSDDNKINYNIWLSHDMFPGFRAWALGFYWELRKTAMAILKALMMSLLLLRLIKEFYLIIGGVQKIVRNRKLLERLWKQPSD